MFFFWTWASVASFIVVQTPIQQNCHTNTYTTGICHHISSILWLEHTALVLVLIADTGIGVCQKVSVRKAIKAKQLNANHLLAPRFIVAAFDGQYVSSQMVGMFCANCKWVREFGRGRTGDQLNESATKGVECICRLLHWQVDRPRAGALHPRCPVSCRVRGQPWIKHADAESPVTVSHRPPCGNS